MSCCRGLTSWIVNVGSHAFIWRQGRAFSLRSSAVARYGTQFALGIQSAGIAATGKHFPGVGSARTDTDYQREELHPNASQRKAALNLARRGESSAAISGALALASTHQAVAVSPEDRPVEAEGCVCRRP